MFIPEARMIDQEFIKRSQDLFKEERSGLKYPSLKKWQVENKEKFISSQKKYLKSDKGKICLKRTMAISSSRYSELSKDLDLKEKEEIRNFYEKCPKDCDVDHIIPLSRGGKHCLSNLQYLLSGNNRSKNKKLPEEYSKDDLVYYKGIS